MLSQEEWPALEKPPEKEQPPEKPKKPRKVSTHTLCFRCR